MHTVRRCRARYFGGAATYGLSLATPRMSSSVLCAPPPPSTSFVFGESASDLVASISRQRRICGVIVGWMACW